MTKSDKREVISYKGFDANLSCLGFKYEIGGSYEHTGKVKACSTGFHACPADNHPLTVFNYYPPAGSRYARVVQSGEMDAHGDDKIASARISIECEITLSDLIKDAVKWVFDRANWKDGPVATLPNEGVTASGTQGAATASGDQGAATASGYQGAATASGYQGRTMGKEGCALFLVYRPAWDGPVEKVWAGIAGQNGIKPGTFYTLNAAGEPVEWVAE